MSVSEGIEDRFDGLDVEAVDWVVRLTVGPLTPADRNAFESWRRMSAAHQHAFEAASDLCGHLRNIPLPLDTATPQHVDAAEGDRPKAGNILPFTRPPVGISRRAFLGGGAMAASIAGGLMAVNPPFGLWPSLAELTADQRTQAGERRRFSPVAGVAVELNSRSSASATDGGNGLKLIGGEAFVTVAARDRPFRLAAGGGTIIADDAAFNVETLDDALCVTCVRGTVTARRATKTARIAAGREIIFAADGGISESRADTDIRLAWRRGLIILRRTPLGKAIPQINRYFPGRLVLADAAKRDWPVTGVFHIDQIELAVLQLQRLLDMKATRLPGGVVLLG